MTDQYEKLRSVASRAPDALATVGSDLLRQRGLPAWLDALSGVPDDATPERRPLRVTLQRPMGAVTPTVPPMERAPIISLLGSMLVQCLGGIP